VSEPTYAIWQEPPPKRARISLRRFLAGAAVAVIALMALSALLKVNGSDNWLLPMAIGILVAVSSVALSPFLLSHFEEVAAMPRLREMYAGVDSGALFPVKIKVSVNGVEIGRDIGLVDFESGQLRYQGLRTALNVDRTALVPMNRWPFGSATEFLVMGVARDQHVLSIAPIDRIDLDNCYSLAPSYRKALGNWLETVGDLTNGEVFPPDRLRYREDFKTASQYAPLLIAPYISSKVYAWLGLLREPLDALQYVGPLLVAGLAVLYIVRVRRINHEFLEANLAPNSASPSP
jgi:hypothetical protein